MKILFVFTGGTISTTLTQNVMSVDKDKPYALIKSYEERFGKSFEYDCVSPYLELSENNTGKHLSMICECVKSNVSKGYDGVIVTHGTDTLQYSASALAYTFGNNSIPICLVSASFPLENTHSNALDNLHGAVNIIKHKLGKGVFVPFRNTKDNFVKVHRATKLLPSIAFSDEVISLKNCEYGKFDNNFNFIKNHNYSENNDGMQAFVPAFSELSPILFLHAYVGINYPPLSQNIKYVLISSYHSGTIDTKSESAKNFYNTAKEMGIKVFVAGVSGKEIYESEQAYSELSITPLPLSPISAFVKLWLIATNKVNDNALLIPLGGDL